MASLLQSLYWQHVLDRAAQAPFCVVCPIRPVRALSASKQERGLLNAGHQCPAGHAAPSLVLASGQELPTWHSPGHAASSEAWPTSLPNLPAGHGCLAPSPGHQYPALQEASEPAQPEVPGIVCVPPSQVLQDRSPAFQYRPAGHSTHRLIPLTLLHVVSSVNRPVGQYEHIAHFI